MLVKETNRLDGSCERACHLGDCIVNLRAVGIDADLNRFDCQRADALGFFLTNHECIRLEPDTKTPFSGVFKDMEEVLAKQNFAATDREKKNARLGELVQKTFDFDCSHLTAIVVIEVTMNAPHVTAISDIQMDRQRNAKSKRFRPHLVH